MKQNEETRGRLRSLNYCFRLYQYGKCDNRTCRYSHDQLPLEHNHQPQSEQPPILPRRTVRLAAAPHTTAPPITSSQFPEAPAPAPPITSSQFPAAPASGTIDPTASSATVEFESKLEEIWASDIRPEFKVARIINAHNASIEKQVTGLKDEYGKQVTGLKDEYEKLVSGLKDEIKQLKDDYNDVLYERSIVNARILLENMADSFGVYHRTLGGSRQCTEGYPAIFIDYIDPMHRELSCLKIWRVHFDEFLLESQLGRSCRSAIEVGEAKESISKVTSAAVAVRQEVKNRNKLLDLLAVGKCAQSLLWQALDSRFGAL
jgi:hypothetical protein